MKKLFSFILVLALVFSLSVTAFAAGNITISNATIGEDYEVYKIFSATFNADGDVSYTILPTDQFFDDLFGADGTETNEYFDYEAATGVVTLKSGIDKKAMFEYLETMVAGATYTARQEDVTSEEVVFSGICKNCLTEETK